MYFHFLPAAVCKRFTALLNFIISADTGNMQKHSLPGCVNQGLFLFLLLYTVVTDQKVQS